MTRLELLEIAKPILFNAEMVRAILNNEKSVTRRPIKNNPEECTSKVVNDVCKLCDDKGGFYLPDDYVKARSPYKVGDILYVRETWGIYEQNYINANYFMYRADFPNGAKTYDADGVPCDLPTWRPSTRMPKEAARIFLRVTDVRVERLQDIITGDYRTPLNINKEGLILSCCFCKHHNGDCKDFIAQHSHKMLTCKLLEDYILLWNSTVKKSDLDKYGWDANPWVWVIEFEKVEV